MDFEPEDEDLMEEEVAMEDAYAAPPPKLRSTITGGDFGLGVGASQHANRRTKGRGFREEIDRSSRYALKDFDSLDAGGGPGPQKCRTFLPRGDTESFVVSLLLLLPCRSLGLS